MDMQGAEEMAQMEHLLNVYASRAAKGSIADFVGYVEVDEDEATTKLTQGIWLVSPICQLTMRTCQASIITFQSFLCVPRQALSARKYVLKSLCVSDAAS